MKTMTNRGGSVLKTLDGINTKPDLHQSDYITK